MKEEKRIKKRFSFISRNIRIEWNPPVAVVHSQRHTHTHTAAQSFQIFKIKKKNGQQINIPKYECNKNTADRNERRNEIRMIIIIIKEYKRLCRPKQANKLNRLLLNFSLLNKLVSLTVSSVLDDQKI